MSSPLGPRVVAVAGLTAWMTLCDRFFHVATSTVVHFWKPFMGEQTVWVIAIFGLASIGIVATAPRFAVDRSRPLRFVTEVLVMTAIYASSGYFGAEHPQLVTAAFAALFMVRLAASRERQPVLIIAVALAIIGPAWESLQWQLGMFEYTNADILGVPWWLIPFYANGAWAIRELGALITSRARERAAAA